MVLSCTSALSTISCPPGGQKITRAAWRGPVLVVAPRLQRLIERFGCGHVLALVLSPLEPNGLEPVACDVPSAGLGDFFQVRPRLDQRQTGLLGLPRNVCRIALAISHAGVEDLLDASARDRAAHCCTFPCRIPTKLFDPHSGHSLIVMKSAMGYPHCAQRISRG